MSTVWNYFLLVFHSVIHNCNLFRLRSADCPESCARCFTLFCYSFLSVLDLIRLDWLFMTSHLDFVVVGFILIASLSIAVIVC